VTVDPLPLCDLRLARLTIRLGRLIRAQLGPAWRLHAERDLDGDSRQPRYERVGERCLRPPTVEVELVQADGLSRLEGRLLLGRLLLLA